MVPSAIDQPTMTGHEVAQALGCSYSSLMRAVAEDRSPVCFVRIGSRVTFPTAAVRRVLHLDPPPNGRAS